MLKEKVHSITINPPGKASRTSVTTAELIENYGIEGDANAGGSIKQVNLITLEQSKKQPLPKAAEPAYYDNIITEGISPADLNIGDKLVVGTDVVLEISCLGYEHYKHCNICCKPKGNITPLELNSSRVLRGGQVKVGDEIIKVSLREN